MTHRLQAILAASTMAAALLSWNTASACSAFRLAKATAFPTSGASNVSPMTSIKLVLGPQTTPTALSLSTANATIPLPAAQSLGLGFHQSAHASFWLFSVGLSPSTDYVLTDSSNGTPVELTRFTTAASYDKVQGPAATLESLRLWRVRYPVSQIAAGGCVFAEYEGYIELNFPAVVLPGTPEDEVVQVVQLTPKTGGLAQSQVYTGNTTRLGTVLGQDGWPAPAGVSWKPELAPDREYCASIAFYGRNDLALLPLRSNTICAPVISLDRSDGSNATPPNPADLPDASSSGVPTGQVNPTAEPSSSSSGCSYVPSRRDAGLWFVLGLALVGRLRRAGIRSPRPNDQP
ncbi:MAG TPA: hypothetical protein VF518_05875 [Polyangia bacterium]